MHPSKLGSWSLLVSLSFALVAAVKATEGRLYGRPGVPSVVTAGAVVRAAVRLLSGQPPGGQPSAGAAAARRTPSANSTEPANTAATTGQARK